MRGDQILAFGLVSKTSPYGELSPRSILLTTSIPEAGLTRHRAYPYERASQNILPWSGNSKPMPMSLSTLATQLASLSVDDHVSLTVFQRQYMQRVSVSDLSFPPSSLLSHWDVQQWIWQTVDYMQKHNSNATYERLFLKTLLLKLEQAVEHVPEPV